MDNNLDRFNHSHNFIASYKDDMMIPFIKIIQSSSDEMIPGREKYNASVKPGDIYSSLTQTVFIEPQVIICGMKKYFAEWQGNTRGKLITKHLSNSEIVLNAIKEERLKSDGSITFDLKTKEGNYLLETYGVVLLIKNKDGLILPGRFTFSKSSFLDGKKLNTNLVIYQRGGLPVFSLSSNLTSNSKGSWYKPNFVFSGYETDKNIINMCQNLSKTAELIILD